MRKLLYTISLTAFLFFFSNLVSAQTINNSADLEKFYTEYFNNKQSRDALVKSYCTDSLYQAWKESESDAPLVHVYCDTYRGVTIRRIPNKNQYHVAFGIWQFTDVFVPMESVDIYVDKGKIYKAEQSETSISTSDLNGTKWITETGYITKSEEYYEFTQDTKIWHQENGGSFTYPYYLAQKRPAFFDHSKVGAGTKGQYYIEFNNVLGSKNLSTIIYFNKEAGVMIAKPKGGFENYFIMKDKDTALEFFQPREFPVNGPKVSQW